MKLVPILFILFAGPVAFAEPSPASDAALSGIAEPQENVVSGRITDESGAAIPGASIIIQGTRTATISDGSGNFQIRVPESGSVLVVSFLGYVTQEIPVGGRRTIDVQMQMDAQQMEDVIVVGYGSVSKRELTSSVAQVRSEDFISGAFTSPLSMIDGKVSGVNITNINAADPNAGASVQIRGASSISAGNDPLIIVDGVPGVDLRNITNQDIESMTILKDGSAAAIYGSRAANGVILIETKKGRAGKISIQYDGYADHDMVAYRPDVLSPEEYVQRGIGTDMGYRTRWYDELLNKDNIGQNHYLAVSGGGENLAFRASGNYRTKDGMDIASFRKEYGLRMGFSAKAFNNIVELSGNISQRYVREENANYGVFGQAIKLNPTQPLMDPDNPGRYSILNGYDTYNPVGWVRDQENGNSRNLSVIDFKVKVNILRNLNTELSLARQSTDYYGRQYINSNHKDSYDNDRKGYAALQHANSSDYTLEWIGNYYLDIDRHSIKLMAGYSYQEFNYRQFQAQNGDFPSDAFLYNNLGAGAWMSAMAGRLGMASSKEKEKMIGFPVRLNYSYDDTWFLTASVRYEGNTKFGVNNKWGLFPAASAAWRISNLPAFEDSKVVDDLKLRFSYGSTGRSGFPRYSAMSTYNVSSQWDPYGMNSYQDENGQWIRNWGPDKNPNPNLRWEKQISYNLGVDFALFGNRLTGSFDAFLRQGKDVLSTYAAPQPPNLYNTIFVNVATTSAKGMELALNWNVVKKQDFTYDTNLVVSNSKTILDKFSNDIYKNDYTDMYSLPQPGSPGYAQRLSDGGEIGTFWGWKYAGVDTDGTMLVWKGAKEGGEKVRADGTATTEDAGALGHGAPRWTMSWGNTFRYKNFDLSLYFQGRFGYKILNMYQMYYGLTAETGINLLQDAFGKNAHIKSVKNMSDYFLEPGDYFSLDNITLGWTPRLKSKYIGSVRLYATMNNAFILTKFSVMSPKTVEINGMTPGISGLGVYPQTRSIMFGVQLSY